MIIPKRCNSTDYWPSRSNNSQQILTQKDYYIDIFYMKYLVSQVPTKIILLHVQWFYPEVYLSLEYILILHQNLTTI